MLHAMKSKIWNMNNVLRDLYVGLLLYFLIVSVLGVVLVTDKLGYVLGVLVGVCASFGFAYHMYRTLDKGLDMPEKAAQRYVLSRSCIRLFMMLVVAYVGLFVEGLSFLGVVLGLFGLKISALMQPLVSIYITNKIFREGE